MPLSILHRTVWYKARSHFPYMQHDCSAGSVHICRAMGVAPHVRPACIASPCTWASITLTPCSVCIRLQPSHGAQRCGLLAGRWFAKQLALLGQQWSRNAAQRMPQASGDIREIVNEPFFVPLYSLFRAYGPIFKLCIGPQTFVVISDPKLAKQVLSPWPIQLTNAVHIL